MLRPYKTSTNFYSAATSKPAFAVVGWSFLRNWLTIIDNVDRIGIAIALGQCAITNFSQ